MNNTDAFEEKTSIHLFKKQIKEIDAICKNNPYIFSNRSHFIRCAVNYFTRAIRTGEFKINIFEVE